MNRTLSPRDLAAAVGVSESSLKRWADQGAVRYTRTAGGHRRIAISDAVAFVRESKLPVLRPDLLGLADVEAGAVDDESAAARLRDFLLEGRAEPAKNHLGWLYLQGWSVAAICDGPLRAAMTHLGELWHDRKDGIFLEHRATDICIQGLIGLHSLFRTEGTRPTVVGGAPSGDPYLVPSMMAATSLVSEGFETVNLGPDTPVESLEFAARLHQPLFVWLSVSGNLPVRAVKGYVEDLLRRLAPLQVHLIVGGRSVDKLSSLQAQHLHVGGSMGELVAFARGLALAPPVRSAGAR